MKVIDPKVVQRIMMGSGPSVDLLAEKALNKYDVVMDRPCRFPGVDRASDRIRDKPDKKRYLQPPTQRQEQDSLASQVKDKSRFQ